MSQDIEYNNNQNKCSSETMAHKSPSFLNDSTQKIHHCVYNIHSNINRHLFLSSIFLYFIIGMNANFSRVRQTCGSFRHMFMVVVALKGTACAFIKLGCVMHFFFCVWPNFVHCTVSQPTDRPARRTDVYYKMHYICLFK